MASGCARDAEGIVVRRSAWITACLVLLPLLTALSVLRTTDAAFTGSAASTGNSFAGDSLQPASGVTAAHQCTLGIRSVRVTWTASPSTWATTYRVLRSVNAGAWASVATVAYGTDTWTDSSVFGATSYAYRVRVERTGWSWTSSDATSNTVSTPALCL